VKNATIEVRVLDSAEAHALPARLHLALGDARAWLDDQAPQWVRDEINEAFELTRGHEPEGAHP
jgi:hypothetical protein